MAEINVGINIAIKRKEKGITQEELANFIGVSKAAVSKWESNQSYPDITLLPIIATYFDVSVDELLGYHPQLSKEKIKALYVRLSDDFGKKPFQEVYEECMEYIKKYYSCWRLQFHIALLLVNHGSIAGDKEACSEIYKQAESILQRVIKNSQDSSLSRQATYIKATCLLMRNEVDSAILDLESITELYLSSEVLLANAYEMKGEVNKSISILQEYIYISLLGILGSVPSLIRLYGNDKQKVKLWSETAIELANIFKVKEVNPSTLLSIYYITAYIHVMQGERQEAISMLEEYVKTAKRENFFPIKLGRNELFDSIEHLFERIDLGGAAPRSDKVIKEDIKSSVINNPMFNALEKEDRFIELIKRLKEV
ncbi:helix-turn-helix domain-containing protein [Clostridium sp. UBA4548]|uniref:helix-turn-helix domain-containing protein n=1 Tax=Clostridium sp. UBA4548 TaxID=1946361 RepID=UPI0025C00FC0|nr:helix-turn-helix transcriptional regulator [Clostridium sp. UBA4548]